MRYCSNKNFTNSEDSFWIYVVILFSFYPRDRSFISFGADIRFRRKKNIVLKSRFRLKKKRKKKKNALKLGVLSSHVTEIRILISFRAGKWTHLERNAGTIYTFGTYWAKPWNENSSWRFRSLVRANCANRYKNRIQNCVFNIIIKFPL